MAARRFYSFREFWPYYLQQHARRGTRMLHYAGTTMVVALVLAAMWLGHWAIVLALPVAGYGFAWAGHGLVERNRPATFRHPLWSLRGDFLMWQRFLTGRIGQDLERAGVRDDGSIDPARRVIP